VNASDRIRAMSGPPAVGVVYDSLGFPAVQPISNTYTFSLWLAPGYEGQLSATSGNSNVRFGFIKATR
jgi:hypothetical protein